MLFFRRVLPHLGHIGFAILQIAVDAGHEQHQQHRDHHEADPGAKDMQVEQMAFEHFGKVERPVDEGQPGSAERRHGHDAPRAPMMQQHGAERHLHQIEGDEGIGRPAAEIKLRRQSHDIEEEGEEQFGMADIGAPAHNQYAAQIHGCCDAGDDEHGQDRQADAHAKMYQQDGGDLPRNGDPAQLDQQDHILAPGGVGRPAAGKPARAGRRGAGHGRLSVAVCRMTMM